jgi:outer membrane protein OmpA-like peptidoglycan-associated protein
MSKRFFIACLSILLFSLGETSAQGDQPIELSNPSFEDFARPGQQPRGWYDCGDINYPLETAPDVHPIDDSSGDSSFGVKKKAIDGDTYLGMVVRENDSYESIAQRLKKPLMPGKCYSFSIYVASSKIYKSQIRGSKEFVNFTTPIKLSIKGGGGFCDNAVTLAETELITHSEWKEYVFKFEPKRRISYIVLEARYQTPTFTPPNGNILLDNASAIQPIPCDESLVKKPIVEITTPSASPRTVKSKKYKLIANVKNVTEKRKILLKVNGKNIRSFTYNPATGKVTANLKLKEGANKVIVKAANTGGNTSDDASINYEIPVEEPVAVVEPKSGIEEGLGVLKTGETIRVDQLNFEIDSFKITIDSRPVLNDIFKFLNKNAKVSVEIGGHTNRFCDTEYCQTLSTDRAKAVVDFLVQKGIPSNRLTYRGYGKTKPLTFSRNAEAQKKNQRVEIKILSLGS